MRLFRFALVITLALASCKKDKDGGTPPPAEKPAGRTFLVGLVTDIGGRGDQSFNDSALRGLEAWSADQKSVDGKYVALSADERKATVPAELTERVKSVGIKPIVVQSKAQEDYQPNLQLVVDQGAHAVRLASDDGRVLTLVGQLNQAGQDLGALPARLASPVDVWPIGRDLYITTTGSRRLLKASSAL